MHCYLLTPRVLNLLLLGKDYMILQLTGKCTKQMHEGYIKKKKKNKNKARISQDRKKKILPARLEALLNSFLLLANCSPE